MSELEGDGELPVKLASKHDNRVGVRHLLLLGDEKGLHVVLAENPFAILEDELLHRRGIGFEASLKASRSFVGLYHRLQSNIGIQTLDALFQKPGFAVGVRRLQPAHADAKDLQLFQVRIC